jgi:hypothetical protein
MIVESAEPYENSSSFKSVSIRYRFGSRFGTHAAHTTLFVAGSA